MIEDIPHTWIPMPDGVQLSARIWRPSAAPCPAILEIIPYRKRDLVRARDERNHPYFAARGYACLRVDMRGSGDSEGLMPDMYHPNELADTRHIIEWVAGQRWCNGRVGLFGTSWGGTASLQAAVDAPGPLKAVIANCATIDRFEDDIHWMGGCLLSDSLEWGATLPAILACPPDKATVGEDWRAMWEARLAALPDPVHTWARERRRGTYWRHGSVRFATDRLRCPILNIGGWSDRYSNSVVRLVRARPDLAWGIVGPWGHHYPDQGEPGPAIGFQQLALEWWDHWLKHESADREPASGPWPRLRLWRRGFDQPQDRLAMRTGEWLETDDTTEGPVLVWRAGRELRLRPQRASDAPTGGASCVPVPCDPRHGEAAGDTGYFGRVGGLPLDQQADDARGLCFETEALVEPLDLHGHLSLRVGVPPGEGQLACRLCDVAPDGRSLLITRTVRALALADDLDTEIDDDSDTPIERQIEFPMTVYRLAPGHRLRLVLAGSYWPLVWPSAAASTPSIDPTSLSLHLPSLPADIRPLVRAFPEARTYPARPSWEITESAPLERQDDACPTAPASLGWHQPPTGMRYTADGLTLVSQTRMRYRLSDSDPPDMACEVTVSYRIERPDGVADIRSSLRAAGAAEIAPVEITVHWNGERLVNRRDNRAGE